MNSCFNCAILVGSISVLYALIALCTYVATVLALLLLYSYVYIIGKLIFCVHNYVVLLLHSTINCKLKALAN